MQIDNNINLVFSCMHNLSSQSGVCPLAGFHFDMHYFQLVSHFSTHVLLSVKSVDYILRYLANKLDSVTREIQLYNVFLFSATHTSQCMCLWNAVVVTKYQYHPIWCFVLLLLFLLLLLLILLATLDSFALPNNDVVYLNYISYH